MNVAVPEDDTGHWGGRPLAEFQIQIIRLPFSGWSGRVLSVRETELCEINPSYDRVIVLRVPVFQTELLAIQIVKKRFISKLLNFCCDFFFEIFDVSEVVIQRV